MKYWAVLLTVFNRKDKTLQCLSQLFDQLPVEDIQIDVFLTDDGCTDGTAEAVENLFPSVHILEGSGDLFWNRGMLMAWKAAADARDYDAYLWLNDDTFLYEGTLTSLQRFDKWCNPAVPFLKRWNMLHRPDGMPPRETFYFEKRHYGIIVACLHYLTVHIRCLFPKWWIRKKQPKRN